MKILLLGYFGQDNFGDEAINRAVMRFLINEFGNDIKIYLCNQANYTANITGKFEEDCRGLPSFTVYESWFDSISYIKYDLVVVCNSGFVNGFCLDIVLEAIDKDIPLRIYAMKQGRPSGLRGELYDKILEKAKFTIFRLEDHYKSFDNNCSIVDGVDLAYFNNQIEIKKEDYILITPRFYNEEVNNKEIEFINNLQNNFNYRFKILNCSKDDSKLSSLIKNDNIEIFNHDYTDVNAVIKIISSAQKIISLGRFHPLVFALKYNIPSLYVNFNFSSGHYMDDKTSDLCTQYNIQEVNYDNFVNLDIGCNYNIEKLIKNINNTLNAININFNF